MFYRCLMLAQISTVAILACAQPALAGPPYVSDDPQPTDYKHFEIYAFSNGTATRAGVSGAAGVDCYIRRGIQNTNETDQYSSYSSVLVTF